MNAEEKYNRLVLAHRCRKSGDALAALLFRFPRLRAGRYRLLCTAVFDWYVTRLARHPERDSLVSIDIPANDRADYLKIYRWFCGIVDRSYKPVYKPPQWAAVAFEQAVFSFSKVQQPAPDKQPDIKDLVAFFNVELSSLYSFLSSDGLRQVIESNDRPDPEDADARKLSAPTVTPRKVFRFLNAFWFLWVPPLICIIAILSAVFR